VSVSIDFCLNNNKEAVIRDCLKAICSLPLTSLSIVNWNYSEESKIEEEITAKLKPFIDVVRENKHLKNFNMHPFNSL
jgi:predicted ferric reductase